MQDNTERVVRFVACVMFVLILIGILVMIFMVSKPESNQNGITYQIAEGSVIEVNQTNRTLTVLLDNEKEVVAEVLLIEVKTVLNILDWNVMEYRVAILQNLNKTEFVVLTIFVKQEVII